MQRCTTPLRSHCPLSLCGTARHCQLLQMLETSAPLPSILSPDGGISIFIRELVQEFQASFMAAKQAHAPWLQTPGEPLSQSHARQMACDARYAEVQPPPCQLYLTGTANTLFVVTSIRSNWAGDSKHGLLHVLHANYCSRLSQHAAGT